MTGVSVRMHTSGGSDIFLGELAKCHIKERHIRMLELQPSLPNREIAVADGEELLLVQKEVAFINL